MERTCIPAMKLKLFNTLTRRKEPFEPLTPHRAGIYTCGPTVYGPAHIGNLRSYIFPDILKKTLRTLKFEVTHIINVTDVGHLTSDADTGEDKVEQAARQSQRSAWDIAAEYTQGFLRDLERLNIEGPDVLPRATDHIPEQIAHIRILEDKGYTYGTEDGVYFDTSRFEDYGRLAPLNVEGLREGSRVDMGGKRNKTDFALWKFSPPGANRQMEWDSPWGRGFPGWHIECSAMSMKYLGEQFDIHTGGTDHISVHHTNEIAQSEAATDKLFVRVWLHGEHLVLGGDERMGKSEGNRLLLDDVVARGFEPLSFRYLALNNHYRKYLQFTWQALKAADTALMGLRRHLADAGGEHGAPPPVEEAAPGTDRGKVLEALADDLNTPRALAVLWTAFREGNLSAADKLRLAAYSEPVLSLNLFDFSRIEAERDIPEDVRVLADARWAARNARNYDESDRLRTELQALGYVVRDGADSYELLRG